MSDPKTRRLKELIGDKGTTRQHSLQKPSKNSLYFPARYNAVDGTYGYQGGASIFNPAVASWAINCFAPVGGGFCFDPFAGGGTRAIMAAKAGLIYFGVELRPEEVAATQTRIESAGCSNEAKIIRGDSCHLEALVRANSADFLLTCPPYWNLEQYKGGEKDISRHENYSDFLSDLKLVIAECLRILRPGSLACWIVGLHRHKNGELAPIHHDIARLHQEVGFNFLEEIILSLTNNGAIQRVGNFDKGSRRLIRTHEYLLVFRKPEMFE